MSNTNVILATNKLVNDNITTLLSNVTTCDQFIKYCITGLPYIEYSNLTSLSNTSTFINGLATAFQSTQFQNTLLISQANVIIAGNTTAENSIFTAFNTKLTSYMTKAQTIIVTVAQLFYTP